VRRANYGSREGYTRIHNTISQEKEPVLWPGPATIFLSLPTAQAKRGKTLLNIENLRVVRSEFRLTALPGS
jgi:hypothetical protein